MDYIGCYILVKLGKDGKSTCLINASKAFVSSTMIGEACGHCHWDSLEIFISQIFNFNFKLFFYYITVIMSFRPGPLDC